MTNKNDKDKKESWECRRCNKINSPYVDSCDCEKKENTNEEQIWQDINE
jgi:hypothetical protein